MKKRHYTTLEVFIYLGGLLALAGLLLWIFGAAAKAEEEGRWVRDLIRKQHRAERRRQIHHWAQERRTERRNIYLYEDTCKPATREIGTEHASEEGAKEAALRHWRSKVRFYWGEIYIDARYMEALSYTCSRSSTNETAAGRVAEAVTGGNAQYYRCEIEARPCRAPKQEGEK